MQIRKGDIVEVEFLDHIQAGAHPMGCTVYGRVYSTNKKAITVDSWILRKASKVVSEQNVERFCIVRSAIEKVYKLKRAE